MDVDAPVFAIAAAAELAGMHPQTLRQYDRLGLVSPKRTAGQSRRYSMRDVAMLRQISAMSAEGINLAGIQRILHLERENVELQQRVRKLEAALADELMNNRPGSRVFAAGATGEVVSLRTGARTRKPNQLVLWRDRGVL